MSKNNSVLSVSRVPVPPVLDLQPQKLRVVRQKLEGAPQKLDPVRGPHGSARQKLGVAQGRQHPVHGRREGARRNPEVELLRRALGFLRRGVERGRLEPVRWRLGGAFPALRPPRHVRRGLALLVEGLSG